MKYAALLLTVACVSCAPVPAIGIELVSGVVTLSPAEQAGMQTCKAQGGCFIITRRALDGLLDRLADIAANAVAVATEEAKADCRKKDSI